MKYIQLLILLFITTLFTLNAQEILSPNKNIKVVLQSKKTFGNLSSGQLFFKILYKNGSKYVEVLPDSPLGLSRADQRFTDNLKLIGETKAVALHDKYEMICGKRKICENFGTEKVFRYTNSTNQSLNIVFRAYNNGVAFRYIFPNHSDSLFNIINES
ncbi:MAG: glycoside hydrolase family 97 N-terminal domain-containing protein, partial [Paludibacter sp.]